MIEKMFDSSLLEDYSRPKSKDIYFKTFKQIGMDVFGSGSQIVTNAGTSMLTNTVGTVPEIMSLYNEHIYMESLVIKYAKDYFNYKDRVKHEQLNDLINKNISISEFIENELPDLLEEQIYIDIRDNYLRYKSDLKYRKEVNNCIFEDIDKLIFKKNIPIAFVFIVYAINTFKKNNYLCKNKEKAYKVVNAIYNTKDDFIKKYSEVLQTSANLIDLTDCCIGQYRFVDYQLSAISNVKALPLVLVHLLIDNSNFLLQFLEEKAIKTKSSSRN